MGEKIEGVKGLMSLGFEKLRRFSRLDLRVKGLGEIAVGFPEVCSVQICFIMPATCL
jgi:hypothetical protein